MPENLTDSIDVTQTNIYAEQNRSRNWICVNCVEAKAFTGMIIMMGINPLPSIDLCWFSDPFFRNNEIAVSNANKKV